MDDMKEQAYYREPVEGGEKVLFPGAIKKNKHVMAIMRDNKTWCIAKVMEVRHRQSNLDAEFT